MDFASSPADIVIGGGAAGVGKTFSLLMDALRDTTKHPQYGAIIFRRTYPEIMQEGGLWDESKKIYPYTKAKQNESKVYWKFLNGSKIAFSHLQHEKDLNKFQGAQIPYIGFDELTHFSKDMFFYLLTRNRSAHGVPTRIRATCNPDPDSFVAELIEWWIDQDTGFPIPERAGKVRYFIRDGDYYIWGDTKAEVYDKGYHLFTGDVMDHIKPEDLIKSLTFIPGKIQDNEILLRNDPGYLGNLKSQSEEVRMRLLEGNWKIRADKTNLFDIFMVKDMFTNDRFNKPGDKKFISIDHARFGKDLCVIMTWHGWNVVRMDVMAKSDTNDILKAIRDIKMEVRPINNSHIIIDQDGIGVKDALPGCRLFRSNDLPHKVSRNKPFVKRRREQVYLEAAEHVNDGEASINLNNCYVWENGRKTKSTSIIIRGRTHDFKKMIMDDLRTVKREEPELDKPVEITKKEAQKIALKRSPDFGDTFSMRGEFEFIRLPASMGRV
jgi:hypothetical protein